jgi:hypothetical protein
MKVTMKNDHDHNGWTPIWMGVRKMMGHTDGRWRYASKDELKKLKWPKKAQSQRPQSLKPTV